MSFINLTHPHQSPAGGDRLKWIRPSGATEIKTYRTSVPPPAVKKSYTGAQFYKALLPGERELLINKAKSSDAAGAILKQIELLGLDFNDPDDVTIIGQMVTVEILISDRRDELIG